MSDSESYHIYICPLKTLCWGHRPLVSVVPRDINYGEKITMIAC